MIEIIPLFLHQYQYRCLQYLTPRINHNYLEHNGLWKDLLRHCTEQHAVVQKQLHSCSFYILITKFKHYCSNAPGVVRIRSTNQHAGCTLPHNAQLGFGRCVCQTVCSHLQPPLTHQPLWSVGTPQCSCVVADNSKSALILSRWNLKEEECSDFKFQYPW